MNLTGELNLVLRRTKKWMSAKCSREMLGMSLVNIAMAVIAKKSTPSRQ